MTNDFEAIHRGKQKQVPSNIVEENSTYNHPGNPAGTL